MSFTDAKRLELIAEAIKYCQRVKSLGMPAAGYTKALREPIYFLWERRNGTKKSVAKFRSRDAVGLEFGSGELVYDHAIPFNYLQRELLNIDNVTEDKLLRILNKYDTVVLITKEDDAALFDAGYGRSMPEDWDGIDPLARYKAIGLELVDNESNVQPEERAGTFTRRMREEDRY